MLQEYIGKTITLHVDRELSITGKLSNHAPNLYQVTGENNHFVFWNYEIVEIVDNKGLQLIHKYYL